MWKLDSEIVIIWTGNIGTWPDDLTRSRRPARRDAGAVECPPPAADLVQSLFDSSLSFPFC